MSEETQGDTSGLITITRRQDLFISWSTAILLNILVLGLFDEYSDRIVIDSFTILIFTCVVLRALVEATLRLEHWARNFFWQRGGTINRVLGVVAMWAMAQRLGLATSTIQKWEGGTARPRGLSLKALMRLAQRSGFPVEG